MASAVHESAGALPAGISVGHWTDDVGLTGCTVVLAPDGAVAAGEVRGGGPGTRESDLLSPAASAPAVQAVVLSGGSAFGLAAADGVMRWLTERGTGHPTPTGPVPLVPAAVVYDLPLGDPAAHPGPDAGYAACKAAGPEVERGSVGAGTGCTVGKLLGHESWTKGGLGAAWERAGEATICALAVVNAAGDVLAEDGRVLAGVWRDGGYERTVDLLREGHAPPSSARESTTLACVVTDARLTKTEAWLVARACGGGVARAVDPSATSVDGDLVFCLATGRKDAELMPLSALAAHATAAAVRDAVRQARGVPGCPSASDRAA
jgi:L-aminopeptidase/D-esterase-like protein